MPPLALFTDTAHGLEPLPPYQRHSETSLEAARAILPDLNALQAKVLAHIAHHAPLTDEAIAEGLQMNPSTARPRRIELAKKGLILPHPETGRNRSGRWAQQWILTDAGRAALSAEREEAA